MTRLHPHEILPHHPAQGDILGVIDADMQHDEKILPQLIDAVQKGSDLAVGTRYAEGGGVKDWSWMQKLSSNLATLTG